MNLATILVLLVLAAAIVLSIRFVRRKGTCNCNDCPGCCNGCPKK